MPETAGPPAPQTFINTEMETDMSASASRTTLPRPAAELRRWYLLVNGNQHRADLCPQTAGFQHDFMLMEALVPQVRVLAMLMAAERLQASDSARTPDILTEEADWFAARILVFGVRVFHLDISLIPMLKTANRRAHAFATRHGLPFTPAQMRMSLHAGRPPHMLIMETADPLSADEGMLANSLAFSRRLHMLHPLLAA